MKKLDMLRFLKTIMAVTILLGFLSISSEKASAQLIFSEDFEKPWPPTGWIITEDDPSNDNVVWHRNDTPPNYGAAPGAPISGYHAYAESYPAYCGYSYDTSLITPAFSTVGMTNIELQFDYQFWVYSSEHLSLYYRIGAGPWILLEDLPSTGGYTAVTHIVDISVTKGNPSVQLRWRYYNLSKGCDWWTNIDNVVIREKIPVAVPTLNEWGMIVFMISLGLGAILFLRRQKGAKI